MFLVYLKVCPIRWQEVEPGIAVWDWSLLKIVRRLGVIFCKRPEGCPGARQAAQGSGIRKAARMNACCRPRSIQVRYTPVTLVRAILHLKFDEADLEAFLDVAQNDVTRNCDLTP
jgi:hypothetical protein